MDTVSEIIEEMKAVNVWDLPGQIDRFIERLDRANDARLLRCEEFNRENIRLTKAMKPILDVEFGDFTTPWKPLHVKGNRIEGAAVCADGYAFSLLSMCEFGGLDEFINMANAIGEAQRIANVEEAV